MLSVTANDPAVPDSGALLVPQSLATTSNGDTLRPPSPGLQSSSSHSGANSHLSLNNSATSSSTSLGTVLADARRQEIRGAWIDVEGEIPVLNKDGTWTPMFSGTLACKDFGDKSSWKDGSGALLDSHFLWFEKETSPPKTTKSRHVIRPIPLECLELASFDDEPEERKQDLSMLKRVGSCFRLSPTKEQMYSFTIYHSAAKITRRHTLYTTSKRERNRWKDALESAIKTRKSQQDSRMLYEPQVLNDEFFRIPPRVQFTSGINYTGSVACAESFSFPGEDYMAIGCASGIYMNRRADGHSFRKVLDFNTPTSIVAIPEFNKFIVHCESELYSYPLELVIGIYQEDAASQPSLQDSEEKLAQGDGDVLFFKAGRVANRTFIVYTSKSGKKVTSRVFELTDQGQSPQSPGGPSSSYQPLSSPLLVSEDPLEATFILDKVAVYTSKAIYMMELTNAASPWREVVLELSDFKPSAFKRLLTRTKASLKLGKSDMPKILELVGKAKTLGIMKTQNNMLVAYNDLGCFVDQDGKPTHPSFYVQWERSATSYAHYGSHLLLFSQGYIEVRNIETGKLVRMVAINDLCHGQGRDKRHGLLRSGWTEWPKLVAAMTNKENDGSYTERLVELGYSGN